MIELQGCQGVCAHLFEHFAETGQIAGMHYLDVEEGAKGISYNSMRKAIEDKPGVSPGF